VSAGAAAAGTGAGAARAGAAGAGAAGAGAARAAPDRGALVADVGAQVGDLALRVDLAVAPGEVVAVLGPNGAGKTTLLRVLAGLVPMVGGRVTLDGAVLEEPVRRIRTAPEDRAVGVVFQDHLLFPHLTVRDNVAFGLRARGVPRRAARGRADAELARVGLADLAGRRPATLSGGQAQRVALARALAVDPALLLLDEPLAALDVEARTAVRRELRRHLDAFAGPCILITHEPVEAMALADRLVILEAGRVTQEGAAHEVSRRPRSRWVAELVGLNLYRGRAAGDRVVLPGGAALAAAGGDRDAAGEVYAVFHPRAVTLHRTRPEGSARNVWRGTVARLEVQGDRVRVPVDGPVPVVAEVTPAAVAALDLARGGEVWAAVKATEIDRYPV